MYNDIKKNMNWNLWAASNIPSAVPSLSLSVQFPSSPATNSRLSSWRLFKAEPHLSARTPILSPSAFDSYADRVFRESAAGTVLPIHRELQPMLCADRLIEEVTVSSVMVFPYLGFNHLLKIMFPMFREWSLEVPSLCFCCFSPHFYFSCSGIIVKHYEFEASRAMSIGFSADSPIFFTWSRSSVSATLAV